MKFSFILFSISFLLSVFGYGQPVISWDAQEKMPVYSHSKDRKFKLEKKDFELKDTSFIDTGSVYLHTVFVDNDTMYYFVRFFAKGQVFKSDYFITKPTNQECNTITYGKRGYYIVKDSVVIIELYINPYDGYWLYYGKKYGSSFKYTKAKSRCSFGISLEDRRQTSFYSNISSPVKRKTSFQTQATW